ncbi:hypothetical protein [Mangrovihabitans endophyticus]|uniref:Uncharacterized protein n=1 Tax=Mangrovihabitans endophyticus TaxID=1751298 RepID=A0A8J3BZL4_9ACTN|nr:hypothetical protein [Mangrovihabitans endophyticus]GGK89104.1 hypothetical protein GCM10012284_23920 [Mangrovihabitans endophyticus]
MAYANVAAGEPIYASTINRIINRQLNRPMTRLALTANQNLANSSLTPITFTAGSEIRDDRNWHSELVNTSRVTPDLAGRYLTVANVYFAASSSGDRRIYIERNGVSNGNWGRQIANGANGLNIVVSGVWEVNGTTDYLECYGFQSSGGTLAVQGSGDSTFSTMFEVIYLGE